MTRIVKLILRSYSRVLISAGCVDPLLSQIVYFLERCITLVKTFSGKHILQLNSKMFYLAFGLDNYTQRAGSMS